MDKGNPCFWKMKEKEQRACWVDRRCRSTPPSQEMVSWLSFRETYTDCWEFGNLVLAINYIWVYAMAQTIDFPLTTVGSGSYYVVRKGADLGEILGETTKWPLHWAGSMPPNSSSLPHRVTSVAQINKQHLGSSCSDSACNFGQVTPVSASITWFGKVHDCTYLI